MWPRPFSVANRSLHPSNPLEQFIVCLLICGLLLAPAVLLDYWSRARQHTISVMLQHKATLTFKAREEEELATSAEDTMVAHDMHDVLAYTRSIFIQSNAGWYTTKRVTGHGHHPLPAPNETICGIVTALI